MAVVSMPNGNKPCRVASRARPGVSANDVHANKSLVQCVSQAFTDHKLALFCANGLLAQRHTNTFGLVPTVLVSHDLWPKSRDASDDVMRHAIVTEYSLVTSRSKLPN